MNFLKEIVFIGVDLINFPHVINAWKQCVKFVKGHVIIFVANVKWFATVIYATI